MISSVRQRTLRARHALGVLVFMVMCGASASEDAPLLGEAFLSLIVDADPESVQQSMQLIEDNWSPSALPMAVEAYQYSRYTDVRAFLAERIRG